MAIVIIGVNRGGTSAVASSLNSLGISLGEASYAPIHEDMALAKAYRGKNWNEFKRIVGAYDEKYGEWAWKLPDAVNGLKNTAKLFDKPKYIFVFRDLFAIASRKAEALDQDQLTSMKKAIRSYQRVLQFVAKKKPDHLLVSYEKLLVNPAQYAATLLEFLGYENQGELIQNVCGAISLSPKDYLQWSSNAKQGRFLKQHGLRGQLDNASNNNVSGWAMDTKGNNPVTLRVLIDNKCHKELKANLLREDLTKAGISKSGLHGFSCTLPADIETGSMISIVYSNSDLHLIGSPVKYKK
jgi:hypothetical protein